MNKNKTVIIIPTFNEIDNCKIIYKKIRKILKKIHIIFVDDNSPDGTGMAIKKMQKKDKILFLKERENKLGIGSAHKDGIKWAIKQKYNFIITMDADLSHDPNLLLEMIKRKKKYSIIQTNRFLYKDAIKDWGLFRKFLTKFRASLIYILLEIPYDSSGAYRCYNLNRMNINDVFLAKTNGYSFFWESMYIFFLKGYSVLEIPMIIPKRIHGKSKIDLTQLVWGLIYLLFIFGKKILNKNKY